LWAVRRVTALLTAVYMTRMMVMTFWGNERFDKSHHHPHESPKIDDDPADRAGRVIDDRWFHRHSACAEFVFTHNDVNVLEHTLEPAIAHAPVVAEHAK
jgi:hypothetical protein